MEICNPKRGWRKIGNLIFIALIKIYDNWHNWSLTLHIYDVSENSDTHLFPILLISPPILGSEVQSKFSVKQQVQCKTLSGIVSHGKKATITFEFTPSSLELVESFWRFTIPSLGLSVPLLVVGQTKEPRVVIDKSQVGVISHCKSALSLVYIS